VSSAAAGQVEGDRGQRSAAPVSGSVPAAGPVELDGGGQVEGDHGRAA